MDVKKAKQRKLIIGLFIIYLIAITWIILFKFQLGLPSIGNGRNINLIPYSQSLLVNNKIVFSEIYMNVLAFVPFGIFCGMLFTDSPFWKKCLPFIGVSLLYEVLQYVLAIGQTDITDLINNSLGGLIGLLVYTGFCKIIGETYKANKVVLGFALIGTTGMIGLMGILLLVNM